jgi:predicted flap endonuclease-1-like 5' DNA nuclease
MATAAAAAIAAASASVTRGVRPIEPISPLSKLDPNLTRPARLTDALKEQESKSADTHHDLDTLRSVRSDALLSGDAPDEFNDLKRIRGIGVLIEKRLNALGITSYDQIANWTADDIERISHTLDFKGRIERENWVEQARILSSGGHTEFSRRVDKGDVETSKS